MKGKRPVLSREPWCSWCGAFSGQPCMSLRSGRACRTHAERNDPSHGGPVVAFHPPMATPVELNR